MGTKGKKITSFVTAATAGAPSSDPLANLREIYDKLDAVDTKSMTPAQQREWFEQYTTTRQAIMVLETTALAAINQKLGSLADEVMLAVDNCEKALHGVQEAATVIQTIAVALGAIAKIAVLLV